MRSLLFILSLFACSVALAQNGQIAGTVKTYDGEPAEFVNLTLKNTKRGAIVDKEGRFSLRNVPAGNYVLVASFTGVKSVEQDVTVTANQTTNVELSLNESSKELDEVVVSASTNRYNNKNLDGSLRLTTPIQEVPQNIQIVSSDLLKDQQAISMSDGLIRNVSGLTRLEHWADMYTNISTRGTSLQAFRNGFNVASSYWGPLTEDMSFVDHIEFVKGPAGFMLASGNPAGLYNVVTKKPTGQTKGEVSFTAGSFNLYRTTLDLDGKLSKDGRLLYRLNLSAQNKGSFRENEFNDRYVIAPVISYQIDDKTKVTFEYTYQRANMTNVGSYYVFSPNGYAELPREFNMLPKGLEPTKINDHSFFATLNHDLSSNWKFTAQVSRFDANQIGSSAWPGYVNPDYTVLRSVSIWDAKSKMNLGQAFLNGDVQTGAVRHRILAGLDVAQKEYYADWGQYHDLDTDSALFDLKNPNLGIPVTGFPVWDRTTDIETRAVTQGGVITQSYYAAYVQDELGFFDNKVRLTLAGRFTSLKQAYSGPDDKANRFTPRIGLSVNVEPSTSVYALYDQAFTPQSGARADGGKIHPITGSNTEVGIKKDWAKGRWTSSLSLYRIITNNELTADPNSPPTQNFSIEMGQKRAQGVEFDLHGTIVKGLNLVLNYAYTDSKVLKVNEGVTAFKEGDVVPGYATHVANAWLSYKITNGALRGLGINAGGTFQGDRRTFWENPPSGVDGSLPDYFKVDAGIFYDRDRFRIGVNMFNVLDEYLYSGSYYSWLNAFYTQAEAPRNLRLSINYRF